MIRQIKEHDLPLCLEVIRLSFATVAEEFGLTPENCPTNGAFMSLSRLEADFKNGAHMFATYENGLIVGFVQLAKKSGAVMELEKLAVLPQSRHQGYGGRLLGYAKARAMELGADRLTIGIIEENTRLKRWYEANGFISTGTRVFPHLPFTVGFMELSLA